MLHIYLMAHTLSCLFIWALKLNIQDDPQKTYINQIYFVYQTATVVGYGDTNPDWTEDEKTIRTLGSVLLIQYISILFTAYTLGLVGQRIATKRYIDEGLEREVVSF